MLKVLEAFSGIGAQAKALERQNIEHIIENTVDWDINAIVAYDLIHHGKQDLSPYEALSDQNIISLLHNFTLSPDGKSPFTNGEVSHISSSALRCILAAIERSNNLVSITDMTYRDVPEDLDIMTYSFPCQDLSIAGVWHGNMSGINREAHNRSGMLWEIERLLKECVANGKTTPKMLLMENVSNILAAPHKENFQEWQSYLTSIGYYNKIYQLNAKNFGIPQNRKRAFMLSIYIGGEEGLKNQLDNYFTNHNLEDENYTIKLPIRRMSLKDILRLDYSVPKYLDEANESQLHDTPSRQKIIDENDHIYVESTKAFASEIKTITTKQDRNPNSGVIEYPHIAENRAPFRYLTARECFIAMGFDERDYEQLVESNIMLCRNRPMFSSGKLIKMAGNSIVVNILEAIFLQVEEIRKMIFN